MIRADGAYKIFVLEFKFLPKDAWHTASLDHFGSPPGFSASDDCWQKTGVYGTFDQREARRGLAWMRRKNPRSSTRFRLVCVHITQTKVPVPG